MDLLTYARLMRARWRTIAALTMVVTLIAAGASLLTQPTYQSSVKFFVSTSDSSGGVTQLQSGNTFAQQRVNSYLQLINTPRVLEPVAEEAGLELTPGDLGAMVRGSVPPQSVILNVHVTDTDADRAHTVASAVAATLPSTIEGLERVNENELSPVRVSVVAEPARASAPIAPNHMRNIALGLMLGLLLGAGIAVLREITDNKVRDKEDIEALTPATLLGTIPLDAQSAARPSSTYVDPHSPWAESFRTLRTNMRFIDAAAHPRVIVMSSSMPGEGKSTICANLALMLAESGMKTCVIEADLRRPKLLDHLGMAGSVGLTDVLIGQYQFNDVIQPYGSLPLRVLGAGSLPPNPSELLGSNAMEHLLETLRQEFDYVIIDAPPLLPVTDAAVLSRIADGVMLVVASGLITNDHLDRSLESLEAVNANLLGIVLNMKARSTGKGYDSYRYEYVYASDKSVESSGSRAAKRRLQESQQR